MPTRLILPGGGSQLRAYDGLMRLTGITGLDPADNPVLNYQYDRDAVNNILARTTEHGPYQYDYDNLDRLTTADNPTLADEQYAYDPVGNRLSSADTTGPWQYSDSDELLAYSDTQLTYDTNGSLITKSVSGTVTRYDYTLDNRLKRVYRDDGSLDVQYGYDPFGRRLWKESAGQRRYFLYAEEGLIAEADATGNLIRQYGWRPGGTWGTDPLYLKTGGQTYYYHNDHLGTPQKLVSRSGAVVWEARYAAFGEAQAAGTIDNPLRFPGQYYDAETGMHYNYFRYYEPEVGRYVTSDPIGLQGGLNTYGYVEGNPVYAIDPYGLAGGSSGVRPPTGGFNSGMGVSSNNTRRPTNRDPKNYPRPPNNQRQPNLTGGIPVNPIPRDLAQLFEQFTNNIGGPGIPQTDRYCILLFCRPDDTGGICPLENYPGTLYKAKIPEKVYYAAVPARCSCRRWDTQFTGEIR